MSVLQNMKQSYTIMWGSTWNQWNVPDNDNAALCWQQRDGEMVKQLHTQVYRITVIRSPARKKHAQRPRFSLNFMICCKGLMHTACEQSNSNIPCNKYHTESPCSAFPSAAYCMSVISMTCDLYLASQKQWDMQLYACYNTLLKRPRGNKASLMPFSNVMFWPISYASLLSLYTFLTALHTTLADKKPCFYCIWGFEIPPSSPGLVEKGNAWQT